MKMTLRPFLLSVVLLVLAVNQPSFAKGAHGQHGSRAGAANAKANTKAATTRAEPTIAPPVLPSQGATRRNRTVSPNIKIVPPRKATNGQAAGTSTPAVRNAIGQPIVAPKNFVGSEAHVSSGQQALGQGPGGVPPPGLRAAPAGAPPAVSFRPARSNAPAVSVANANRGSGSASGMALTRSAATPTAIGGATRPNYGINGTTIQTKH
ncbi:MAG: hypothetical protein WAV38_25335 [Xanthobacteraceae bacterium]